MLAKKCVLKFYLTLPKLLRIARISHLSFHIVIDIALVRYCPKEDFLKFRQSIASKQPKNLKSFVDFKISF